MAHLDHMPAAVAPECRAHSLRVFNVERHGLFLVHVFRRVERGAEMFRMQMRRRRDHHRVDRTIVQ